MNDNVSFSNASDYNVMLQLAQGLLNEMTSSTDLKRATSLNSSPIDINAFGDVSPLLWLPSDIRESVATEFYDTGQYSTLQRFIDENLLEYPGLLQKFFNSLFHYAVRIDSHVITWNTIVVLSQTPYEYLGNWADMIAVTATRSPYMDIQEMGIRCFENWEDIDACTFLENCTFSEKWLQEYADEVCKYIKTEGKKTYVLSQKNYPWEMAEGRGSAGSFPERRGSRYSSGGIAY